MDLDMYGRGRRQSSSRSLNCMRSSSRGLRSSRHSRSPYRKRSYSCESRRSYRRSRSPSLRSVQYRRRSTSRSHHHRSRSPRKFHNLEMESPATLSSNMMQGRSQFSRKGKTPPRSHSREPKGKSPQRSHSGGSHRSNRLNSSRKSDADRCYTCGELGHVVRYCPKRNKSSFTRGSPSKRPPSNHFRSSHKGKGKRD